jgi:hypothetical protein
LHHDDVRVGAHEAVGADEDAVARGIFLEEREEEALGVVVLEDTGAVVAAPRAVVGGAEVDEEAAGSAGHGRLERQGACRVSRVIYSASV